VKKNNNFNCRRLGVVSVIKKKRIFVFFARREKRDIHSVDEIDIQALSLDKH